MGKVGYGYGSEWHLLRYMGRHREELNRRILDEIGYGDDIRWMDFGYHSGNWPDREWEGLSFLKEEKFTQVRRMWADFWAQRGKQPTWDAVGWLISENHQIELLLVEAKANTKELVSHCRAKGEGRQKILEALDKVREDLGVPSSHDWMNRYYQTANRLATVWFLRNEAKVKASLLNIYFIGDKRPRKQKMIRSTEFPQTRDEWNPLLQERDKYLGVTSVQSMKDYVYDLFIEIRP